MSRKVIYAFDSKFRLINPWVEFDGRSFILKQGNRARTFSAKDACNAGLIKVEHRVERRMHTYEEFVAQRSTQSAFDLRSIQACSNY